MKTCTASGCSKSAVRRGLCSSHWRIAFPEVYQRHKADALARVKTAAGKAWVREYTKKRRDLPHVRVARAASVTRYHDKDIARWMTHNRTARKREITTELTRADFDRLTTQPCVYCAGTSPGKRFVGIDRVDSKLGYTLENSVPCCQVCNQMKSGRTLGDFMAQVRRIAAHTIATVTPMEGRGRLLAAIGVAVMVMGCGSPLPASARSLHAAAFATVRITYACAASDPFPAPLASDHGLGVPRGPSVSWSAHSATGTVIDEQHALTAAHVITPCPWIPMITAWVGDRPLRMAVEKQGADVVRLAILSGSRFGLGAPALLGSSDGAHYRVSSIHGTYEGDRRELAARFHPGDSGAGVYTPAGLLVGVLLGLDDSGLIQIGGAP